MKSRWELLLGFLSIIGMVAMFVVFSRAEEQPEVRINPTMSAQPSATQEVLRTSEPHATPTPAPRFELTAQYLDDLEKENQRKQNASHTQIAADYTQAANEVTTTAVFQAVRGTDMAYDGALNDTNTKKTQNANAVSLEETLQAGIVAKQKGLDDNAVDNARLMASAWRGLLTYGAAGVITLVLAWLIYASILVMREIPRYMQEPEPEPEPLRLEVIDNAGRRSRFEDLPVDGERFIKWAREVVRGSNLGYQRWAVDKATKIFTRPEYDKLTNLMHEMGIIYYVNGDPNQGQRGTTAGIRSLEAWIREKGVE